MERVGIGVAKKGRLSGGWAKDGSVNDDPSQRPAVTMRNAKDLSTKCSVELQKQMAQL
jgi:hypothetical protein